MGLRGNEVNNRVREETRFGVDVGCFLVQERWDLLEQGNLSVDLG